MGLESRSTEWLINRAAYLREKMKAMEAIIEEIKRMQQQNRENFVFVETAEAVIKTIESQMAFIAQRLALIEEEIEKRKVKTKP